MRLTIVMIVLLALLVGGLWGQAPGSSPGLGERPAVVSSEVLAASPELQGGAPGQHRRAPGAAKAELGPVYMYGELMEKPYVFSNVGGDTLYLNGVPYWPIREPLRPWDRVWERLPESEKQRRLEMAGREHAFADSIFKAVRAMHDSGATYEECLEAYAEMYRASPRVRSVSKEENSITITWADGTETGKILGFEPGAPPRTKEEIHKDLMEEFWREIRTGRMIARGYGGYFITAPKPDMERMNRLIERLAAGDTLSAEDVMGTPLWHKEFRMDVSKRKAKPKAKEE